LTICKLIDGAFIVCELIDECAFLIFNILKISDADWNQQLGSGNQDRNLGWNEIIEARIMVGGTKKKKLDLVPEN